MSERVTEKQVNIQAKILADALGSSIGYKQGQYHVDWSGYGCNFVFVNNEHGGTSSVFGAGSKTKRELYDCLYFTNLAIGHMRQQIERGEMPPIMRAPSLPE
jgi:hypothetical protein